MHIVKYMQTTGEQLASRMLRDMKVPVSAGLPNVSRNIPSRQMQSERSQSPNMTPRYFKNQMEFLHGTGDCATNGGSCQCNPIGLKKACCEAKWNEMINIYSSDGTIGVVKDECGGFDLSVLEGVLDCSYFSGAGVAPIHV